MLKKDARSKFSGLIRIVFSVLLITFALGSGACSSGGGTSTSSASSTGALPQPSVNCSGSSCIE